MRGFQTTHIRLYLRLQQEFRGLLGQASTGGQDLVEYALMVGFVAVGVAAFLPVGVTPTIKGIFTRLNDLLIERLK